MRSVVDGRSFFPPLERVRIERMACTDPAAYGVHFTHWDCRSLQQCVVEQGVVDTIHYTTVARILAEASLHPHRSRYWKTATIDEAFTTLAAKVLWCYERVAWRHERGEVVLCLDEKPNIQALPRLVPRQLMSAGHIDRREFEYQRHGTVTLVVAFNVYDGTMRGWGINKNDHEHFLGCVRQVARAYRHAHRLHLIMDNGGSHIDQHTTAYFATHPRLRAVYTPAHASWLNQAELLLRAFTDKYLDRFDNVNQGNSSLITSTPVGPRITAALPIPLSGHGRVGTYTPGQKRRAPQFVPKLTLQSTSATLGR
jgi:DDE superfamily endonuclease